MNINATLFIQAFNFFITYWMLRLFLFKPVITIIEHEKNQEIVKLDIIDQQKKSLEIQEKERQRHWYVCQEYFNTHLPYLIHKFSSSDITTKTPKEQKELSSSDLDHIIADVCSIIGEKIKNVQ